MRNADCGNARIVNGSTPGMRRHRQRFEMQQVLVGLTDDCKIGKRAQSTQLRKGHLGWRGGLVDARMRNGGEELVRARPWDGPLPDARREGFYRGPGLLMEGRVRAMRVYQDVGVNGDQDRFLRESLPSRRWRIPPTSRHPRRAEPRRAHCACANAPGEPCAGSPRSAPSTSSFHAARPPCCAPVHVKVVVASVMPPIAFPPSPDGQPC